MAEKPFVVLEGGSGSGKTTAIKGLRDQMDNWKFLREPGGTEFGNMMREAVQGLHGAEIDPMAAFMAYGAARANLVALEIMPVLRGLRTEQGVMLDRFWYSSYAYQGGEGIDKAVIGEISQIVTRGLEPDLVLYFDLMPELAVLRKNGCVDIDRYDMKELDFHSRVRDAYLELAYQNRERWRVIDASQTREEVLAECLRIMKESGVI